jgi:hypothetical protein
LEIVVGPNKLVGRKCDCMQCLSKPVNKKTIIIVSNKVIKACRAKKIIITKMWIKMALLLLVMIIFSSCDKKEFLMNTNR